MSTGPGDRPRLLVAGIGNIFCSDDGFGVEVIRRLLAEPPPDGARIVDFGIRGVHLAYELLDGYDVLVMVDAAPHGEEPGTVSVLRPDMDGLPPSVAAEGVVDAHGMAPASVFALLGSLDGLPDRTLIVACEPADTSDGIGLSGPVAAAVEPAVGTVRTVMAEELGLSTAKER